MRLGQYLRTPDGDTMPGKMLVAGVVFLMAGLAVGGYGLVELLRLRSLEHSGQRQKGELIFAHAEALSAATPEEQKYLLTARFPAGEGGATKDFEVSKAVFTKYQGATLDAPIPTLVIAHGPGAMDWEPEASLEVRYQHNGLAALLGFLGGLSLMGCALLSCWFQYWRPARRRALTVAPVPTQLKT